VPVFVDHEKRRADVAQVAGRLVAEGGAEALTLRHVAQALGCSTTVVSHYFANKRDLLLATYRAAADRLRGEVETLEERGDLAALMESWMPISRDHQENWRIWLALWDAAATDPELVAEQRKRVRAARERVRDILLRSSLNGRQPTAPEAERLARHTLTVTMGIAVQACFDAEDWPAERQREAVRDHLRAIGWKARAAA
jgi:AcrR family transcriptional regulator